ncbi:armadillo repeat-containing protein 8-like isoform X2 [Lineus longissimus]|uniref:armadillo repeat-containing protein 8-like isoform X2 n=1 Tax=Lineus longissimus TaxID=88925 RepID=UPI00315C64F8
MIPSMMEIESGADYVDQLFGPESEKWHKAIVDMKNAVIGNNKQKSYLMTLGVVPRLLQLMIEEKSGPEMMTESAVVLGSLAKGTEENVQGLIDTGCVSVLLKGLSHNNLKYVEACLRCLRTIFLSPSAPVTAIYQDPLVIPLLISIIPRSITTQECITSILANCCSTETHQAILCSNGLVLALAPLLCSNIYRVQMPSLKCLAGLCLQNQQVAMAIVSANYKGETIPTMLVKLLARDKTSEMQMSAAKCLTYLCRASILDPQDPVIMLKTLPTLIRMCKKDKPVSERIEGAETLAYLIEVNTELQQIASMSDHIISTLSDYFKYGGAALNNNLHNGDALLKKDKEDQNIDGMRQAAFRAFASLGANDEEIRKKIIETENMMEHILNGLNSPTVKVQLASVRCLHSLSRSVQQLRTSFSDHTVWKPLMKLLNNAPDEILTVASSTLCNLLLEFSPSKEPILEQGAVDLLVGLTKRDNAALRLNGIWALMNMAFQAEQKIKSQILYSLGTEQLFRLLSDQDVQVLMKTLGLLRNLLSNKPHIDYIMNMHGSQIIQAVILILEGDHPVEVKEQILCILANVADGDSAKDFIMSNEDVLKKLMNYMIHANVKLQTAATFCVSNLIWNEEEGAMERQAKLREMGVQKLLQQLLSTNDTTLFDKVKTALQQFN